MNHILVYLDVGVSSHGFNALVASLRELTPTFFIKTIDHRALIKGGWEKDTRLLIMPGGRDQPFHTLLQGLGNQRIAEFVAGGGRYLGLCAGGYYGSAFIEFEKGGELEICAPRELAFFPGRAVGPAYGLGAFCYQTEKGARTAQLSWSGGITPTYFNGGCAFEAPESHPGTTTLARYHDLSDRPAAAVLCTVGKGRALLTGAHPEYSPASRPLWQHFLNKILI